jgi:hypothetical protein
LGSLGTAATYRPIVPSPGDYDDGEIGGLAGETEVLGENLPPLPLCPPQTPHACPDANPDSRGGKNMPINISVPTDSSSIS